MLRTISPAQREEPSGDGNKDQAGSGEILVEGQAIEVSVLAVKRFAEVFVQRGSGTRARSSQEPITDSGTYGTRDAASNFAAIVIDKLKNMKVDVGKFNPCLCKQGSKEIRLFYHGDDFVILADENDLQHQEKRGWTGSL